MKKHLSKTYCLFTLLFISGCSGPFLVFPGGALDGPEQGIESASIVGDGALVQLETRPSDPYSVNLNGFYISGSVYLDPTNERTWYTHIMDDARVRIKFEGDETVYTAIAVVETNTDIINQFESDRIVIRLDPR